MGLLDDFKNEPSRTGTLCRVQIVCGQLSETEATELLEAVADKTITAAAIERVLNRKNLRLQASTITRHRRGECTCGQ